MNLNYVSNKSGNIEEAIRGIHSPDFLLLMSPDEKFEEHVAALEKAFPGVPSIGCVGDGYGKSLCASGVSIAAFTGVQAVANVIEHASTMPVKYIGRVEDDMRTIHADSKNTVLIDLCAANDAQVLATISSVIGKQRLPLMGGTSASPKVSANGVVYPDADAYAFVKNKAGRVAVYKENVYQPMKEGYRFIASHTDRSKYLIGQLNGRPAKRVYMETLGISESQIADQTFTNPFGKMIGDDICIISLKEVIGDGIACFRQVNDSDVLTLLEIRDYREILDDTMSRIRRDFSKISAVFSVNCVFRQLYFTQRGDWDDYLATMGRLGSHCGLVGFGEHYNDQFINQTMTCVVFE